MIKHDFLSIDIHVPSDVLEPEGIVIQLNLKSQPRHPKREKENNTVHRNNMYEKHDDKLFPNKVANLVA